MKHKLEERKQTYGKIFRWRLPDGQTEMPAKVEIIGTFTDWKKVPMTRNAEGHWQLALHQIPGHRTHHYMLLVDGKPAQDKNSDGLAVPHGANEERFAMVTARGPRVFMLFAQAK